MMGMGLVVRERKGVTERPLPYLIRQQEGFITLLSGQHPGETWAGAGQQCTQSMGFMETSRKHRLPSLARHAGTWVRQFSDRLSAVRFVSLSSFGIPDCPVIAASHRFMLCAVHEPSSA